MTSPDSEREGQRLAEVYAGKTNEELTSLAAEGGSLTDLAKIALKRELSRRRLHVTVRELLAPTKAPELPSVVTLRQFLTVQEAVMAKSILDSAGIESSLGDQNVISMNWLWSNALGGVKLQVRKADAAIASDLLNQKLAEAEASAESREHFLHTANGSERRSTEATLTLGPVFVFYLICIFLGPVLGQMMSWGGLDRFRPAVVDGGFYKILLIPLAYAFDRKSFSREYWHFPASGLIGVIVVAVLQIMMMSGDDSKVEYYRAIGIILFAPFVEELARAVMVSPLTIRFGSFWAIAITSVLWAAAHNLFWIALVQQTVLTTIFILTRKSLPSSITAHLVMNLIAVAYPQMHAVFPHAFA